MARDVTLIPANPHTVTRDGRVQEREALRVAAYCRVSTNNEDQLLSFDNQVQYYTEHIANKPNYTMADMDAGQPENPGMAVWGTLWRNGGRGRWCSSLRSRRLKPYVRRS